MISCTMHLEAKISYSVCTESVSHSAQQSGSIQYPKVPRLKQGTAGHVDWSQVKVTPKYLETVPDQ